MKRDMDLVEMFDREDRHRLCDLEPDDDPIREEKEYGEELQKIFIQIHRERYNA